MLNTPHSISGPMSARVTCNRLPDSRDRTSKAAPPTARQMVRNHQGGISPSTIFMPGQLMPQNIVTAASRTKPRTGRPAGGDGFVFRGASVNLRNFAVRVRHLEAGLNRRACSDCLVPALHIGELVHVDLLPFKARCPGPDRHVGD